MTYMKAGPDSGASRIIHFVDLTIDGHVVIQPCSARYLPMLSGFGLLGQKLQRGNSYGQNTQPIKTV